MLIYDAGKSQIYNFLFTQVKNSDNASISYMTFEKYDRFSKAIPIFVLSFKKNKSKLF